MHGRKNIKFLHRFFENSQTSNFMKIRPVRAESFKCERRDGQTDMTKIIIAFRKFAEAYKNNYEI